MFTEEKRNLIIPLKWFNSPLQKIIRIKGNPGSVNGYQFKGYGWKVEYENKIRIVEQVWVKGMMLSSKTYKK